MTNAKIVVFSTPDGGVTWTRSLFLSQEEGDARATLGLYNARPGANLRAYRLDDAEGEFELSDGSFLPFANATDGQAPKFADVDGVLPLWT